MNDNTDIKIEWKRGVFSLPDKVTSEYAYEYRYCRCLGHELGTSKMYEIWFDTKEYKWGHPEYEDGLFSFRISDKINPPYYWCYLRDVELLILNSSTFPSQIK